MRGLVLGGAGQSRGYVVFDVTFSGDRARR